MQSTVPGPYGHSATAPVWRECWEEPLAGGRKAVQGHWCNFKISHPRTAFLVQFTSALLLIMLLFRWMSNINVEHSWHFIIMINYPTWKVPTQGWGRDGSIWKPDLNLYHETLAVNHWGNCTKRPKPYLQFFNFKQIYQARFKCYFY